MKKTSYYVLLLLGVGVMGYYNVQNVLPQDEEIVMYGELDEARAKKASQQSMGCSATNAGTLRYSNGCFQYCDGKGTWINKSAGCDASSHSISCTSLPTNANWNTVSSITQTWNGDEWVPTAIGSHNSTPSSIECHFKCNENYTYSGGNNTCIANTKIASCWNFPSNAQTNGATVYTQTRDGSNWTPTKNWWYNTDNGECNFICKTNYTWKDGGCQANTQTASCWTLPGNAQANGATTYTQTWDGSNWTPAKSWWYNTDNGECNFICNTNYTWNNSSCVIANTCNMSAVCNASDINVGGYTIKACNVGAAVAWLGSDSYGCYFQRGNNYGFANAGTISISASLVTNALSYGPSSYSDSVFRYPTDWPMDTRDRANPQNDNLRWGDNTEGYTNVPSWEIPIPTNFSERQWPCPYGYHVPSVWEWSTLIYNRAITKGFEAFPLLNGPRDLAVYEGAEEFANDLKLPLAGLRNNMSSIWSQGLWGGAWSSSPRIWNANNFGINLRMGSFGMTFSNRVEALPVRCFKNL